MSGHKRATIALSQDDLRRLQQAEQRLRTVQNDYQDIRQRTQTIHSEQMWQSFQQVEQRQQLFQSALQGVDEDLFSLEQRTSQALLDQLSQVQQQVGQASEQTFQQLGEQLSEQLSERTSALLQASSQQLEHSLDQLALQHQDELAQLQRSLRKLHRSQQDKQQLALQSLSNSQSLFEALTSTYALPPEARLLEQDLANAQANCANGLFEAAILGAQQASARLSDLRLRLEQELARRSALLAAVLAAARQLYETGLRCQSVPALDLDGQPLDFSVDVPFWSCGLFQAWCARCQGLLTQLESQGASLDLDELLRLQQQELPALEQALSDLLYQARLNVIASQVRFNIAACIVQALQEQGFQLSEAAYDSADQRSAYQASLRAFDGSQVVVHVNPLEGEAATADIDLVSHDAEQRTQHELRQRAREMALSLQAYGLQVGRFSVPLQEPALRECRSPYSTRQPSRSPVLAAGEGEQLSHFTYPDTPAAHQAVRSLPRLSNETHTP